MPVNSFMDIVGGIANAQTRVTQGSGGVINVNNMDGTIETFMPTANGYVGINNHTTITDTSNGFNVTSQDYSSSTVFTQSPTGYTGSDGSSIMDTQTGIAYSTPDTQSAFMDSHQADFISASENMTMGQDHLSNFDLSHSVDGLPEGLDLSAFDDRTMSIGDFSDMSNIIDQNEIFVSSMNSDIFTDVSDGDMSSEIIDGEMFVDTLDGDMLVDAMDGDTLSTALDSIDLPDGSEDVVDAIIGFIADILS